MDKHFSDYQAVDWVAYEYCCLATKLNCIAWRQPREHIKFLTEPAAPPDSAGVRTDPISAHDKLYFADRFLNAKQNNFLAAEAVLDSNKP